MKKAISQPEGAAGHAVGNQVQTLDSNALAARWYVTTGHLANERSAGTSIPYVKRGGRVFYMLSDVLAAEAAAMVVPVGRAA